MSRTPGTFALPIVRGATWEDEITYRDEAGQAIDLTGYEAKMQVRTLAGQYGPDLIASLVYQFTTSGDHLAIDTPPGETVPCRIRITVPAADHALLNPANIKKAVYAYAIDLTLPGVPNYVIPLVTGKLTVRGNTIR